MIMIVMIIMTYAAVSSHHCIVLSGRGDRVQGVEGDVVTTEVCPRSRPEGRRLDPSLSLPPPPLQEKPR